MEKIKYDIGIIGGGPAGITAAIYALRENKNVILFEKDELGGQILNASIVENIPGFEEISGTQFIDRLTNQMCRLSERYNERVYDQLTIVEEEVLCTDKEDRYINIHTANDTYEVKTLIIAAGSQYKHLNVPGEAELIGKGISFCATCDAPFTKGSTVAVIGGGDSALSEALELSNFASKVIIIQDLPDLTGNKRLQEKCFSKGNITICLNFKVVGFKKDKKIQVITNNKVFSVDHVFEAIGMAPQNDRFGEVCEINTSGYITDCIGGVYCAGDCKQKDIRQVVTACADGAEAALKACKFLEKNWIFF